MTTNIIEPHAGAIASNAGDDFHVLWAAKKMLNLVLPDTALTGITLEGPNSKDIQIDMDGNALLSIDIGEYFGGTTIDSAAKVVFSQLKYSTYEATKPWTVAELCYTTKKRGNNSIIRRLADTYKEYGVLSPNTLTLKLMPPEQIKKHSKPLKSARKW